MNEKQVIHPEFQSYESRLDNFIADFDQSGKVLGQPARNAIKLFKLEENTLAIKSFRIPNLVNQIAYRFFRKSKAERSYRYAEKLLNSGLGTPRPIAYYEFYNLFLFKDSYYICEFVDTMLTYRELTFDFNLPDWEEMLRAFTRFTYQLHENGVNFLDHSPGNTLIRKNEDTYEFYLVDLNRMAFGKMDLQTRIRNFRKLTIHKDMVEIMSDEYAKLIGEDCDYVFKEMWQATEEFQENFHRKRRLKNKLLFWRPNK